MHPAWRLTVAALCVSLLFLDSLCRRAPFTAVIHCQIKRVKIPHDEKNNKGLFFGLTKTTTGSRSEGRDGEN